MQIKNFFWRYGLRIGGAAALLAVSLLLTIPAQAIVVWVGNPIPLGGSQHTLTSNGVFDAYYSVYDGSVTEPGGQGAGISCQLYYSEVANFSGGWLNPQTAAMVYVGDDGNNDRYRGTLSNLEPGLYELTARCMGNGSGWVYASASNLRLVVTNDEGGSCQGASPLDNTIYWTGLGHNSFETTFRSPFGAVKTDQGTVDLRLRTCAGDASWVKLRLWNDYSNTETWYDLQRDLNVDDPVLGRVTLWKLSLPVPVQPSLLYYIFQINDGSNYSYYRDDDPKFYGGGWGSAEADLDVAKNNSYQLTVYDQNFTTPDWLQQAVIYQIFPDRFRNGDPANDPAQGGDWIYGDTVRKLDWSDDLCDPRSTCPGEWGNQFFGGDLQGIIDELDYLSTLGVTSLYLNPIFEAPSNHLYDTQNFLLIDPYFGDLADFQTLASEAEARGIRLILDGVFNHVSSDSQYFDRYQRWDAGGNLTSPSAPGSNDQSGACESTASAWRSWFTFFSDASNKCYDGTPGSQSMSYFDWAGYDSLAKLNSGLPAVQNYIYSGGSGSVARYWLGQGADGWRFDVGGDVEHGSGSGDAYGYWSGFRTAARTEAAHAALLGEEWGDASPWLVGDQWDSVMNYRFRSAVLSWMFDGCSGDGCTGGTKFEDNDSNDGSSSGAISGISVSQFDDRLNSIREDYPPDAWYAMMNLMGSHDTNRVLFLLKKISNDSASAALDKFKFLGIMQFTYPGAPTLYYGDEAGLASAGVWDSLWGKWEDDPYNRAPYPWADQGRTPDIDLQDHFRKLAVLRSQYPVLQTGDLQTLLVDNSNRIYAVARSAASTDLAVVALNRDAGSAHTVSLSGLDAGFNGMTLYDVLNCSGSPLVCPSYTVSSGGITNLNLPALWGAVLVEGPLPAYQVSLSSSANKLNIDTTADLTVTVTNLGGEPAADGTQVDLSLVSGLGSLSAATATVSGGAGQALVSYQAPSASTVAVIRASSGSYAAAQAATTIFVGYGGTVAGLRTEQTGIGPQLVDLPGVATVHKAGLGEPVISLARFDEVPGAGGNMSPYIDLHLSNSAGVDSLTLVVTYTIETNEAEHTLYWRDGAAWVMVSDPAGVVVDPLANTVSFAITASTSPTLSDLSGTGFVVGNGENAPTAVIIRQLSARSASPGWLLAAGLGLATGLLGLGWTWQRRASRML